MYIKIISTLALLAGGHFGWQFYQDQAENSQNNLEHYTYVGEQLTLDSAVSVSGLDRVHIPKWREKIPQGLHNLSAFEVVDSQRTLRFEAQIYAFELLMPVEQLYMKKRKEVLIKARAFLYGQEECKRLKAILASACKIKDMKISQDDYDFITINYEFGFVQKAHFGEVNAYANLKYAEEHAHFYQLFKNSYSTLEVQEETRTSYYKKIVKYCDKIRGYIGTCAIDDINFHFVSMDNDESRKNAIEINAVLTSLVSIENYEAEF